VDDELEAELKAVWAQKVAPRKCCTSYASRRAVCRAAARHAAQGLRSNVQQKAEDSDEDIVGPQVLRACMSARACVFGACVIVRACAREYLRMGAHVKRHARA
jgi:hypothetical protein